MKNRSPIAVFFLTLITIGIYGIVWSVKTKNEMNRLGAEIPTAWLIIVPFVNIWWLYKYSEGAEKITGGKISAILAFILLWILGLIGMAILQNEFNKVGAGGSSDAGPSLTPPVNNTFGDPTSPSGPTTPPASVV